MSNKERVSRLDCGNCERFSHDGAPYAAGHTTLPHSFLYAARGIGYAVVTQRNMKIHLAFAVLAIVLGVWLRIDAHSWAAVAICIALVTATECMNTAIELIVDAVSPGYSEFARHAKDCAAGCVLLCALGSVAVAIAVFGGPLLALL
ncbi:diacylglycerol kinase family protein [Adlercreutzia sp. ZJ138]|uniref:diacylglycerol kinase family protein n=1 Tax=Adlercreutzia sp. ZJ138 TaxID=2709405 RepID=UPI001F155DD9|nr:diacylglycerol kinase family protein [Adlercreutzia sp. ZJ138]